MNTFGSKCTLWPLACSMTILQLPETCSCVLWDLLYKPVDQNIRVLVSVRSAEILQPLYRWILLNILWWLRNLGQPLFVYTNAILVPLFFSETLFFSESCTQNCHSLYLTEREIQVYSPALLHLLYIHFDLWINRSFTSHTARRKRQQ